MLIEGVDLAEDKVQLGSIVRLGEWGPELRECQSEGLQMPVYVEHSAQSTESVEHSAQRENCCEKRWVEC